MNNVTQLHQTGADQIIEHLTLEKDKMDALFTVHFIDGSPVLSATGDLSQLSIAALCLQEMAMQILSGTAEFPSDHGA